MEREEHLEKLESQDKGFAASMQSGEKKNQFAKKIVEDSLKTWFDAFDDKLARCMSNEC